MMDSKDAKDTSTANEAELSSSEPSNDDGGQTEEQRLRSELLYLRADFENARKRLLREQENSVRFANEKFVTELMTIVDLFERGLDSAKAIPEGQAAEVGKFVAGIEMTYKELVHVLARTGVELVGKIGESFDPNLHEAVGQMPVAPDQIDRVVAVAQKGCSLNQRLLKPARVIVGVAQSA